MYHDKEISIRRPKHEENNINVAKDYAWGNGERTGENAKDPNLRKKRRFGINDNIIPSKKVLKHFDLMKSSSHSH